MKNIYLVLDDTLHTRLREAAWKGRKTLGDTLRAVLDEHLPEAAPEESRAPQALPPPAPAATAPAGQPPVPATAAPAGQPPAPAAPAGQAA